MPISSTVATARPKSKKQALYCAFVAYVVLVATQIAIPLTDSALEALTSVAVVTLTLLTLCLATLGQDIKRIFKIFTATYLFALFAEAIGHRSGLPFGEYGYSDQLQPQLLGVPVIIPLAWFAMAVPAWEISNRLTAKRWLRPIVGGLLLGAWDLMLDPQMVTNGFWTWEADGAWYGIPLSNFVGWMIVGAILVYLIGRQLDPDSKNPFLVLPYLWMGIMSSLGFLLPFVFDVPVIGIVGGLAMSTLR